MKKNILLFFALFLIKNVNADINKEGIRFEKMNLSKLKKFMKIKLKP